MLVNRISNPILRTIVEWILALVFAFALFFVVRTFIFRIASVEGPSMMPTLQNGDMVFLNRFSYLFIEPQVGDIVAFPNPSNPSQNFIKRIIGSPGDIVDFRAGMFYLNGEPLNDAFSHETVISFGSVQFPVTVEEGRFFVLGDNRNGSMDSRHSSVGNVYSSSMIGRVAFRIWPLTSFGRVDG